MLRGSAKPGKHDKHAYHVVESAKYGGYFISNDDRTLKKAAELCAVTPQLIIITPTQFLKLYSEFERG